MPYLGGKDQPEMLYLFSCSSSRKNLFRYDHSLVQTTDCWIWFCVAWPTFSTMPGSVCMRNVYSCPVYDSKLLSMEQCGYLICGDLAKLKLVKIGFICSFLCNCCLESEIQPEASRKIAVYCLHLSVFLRVSLCSWLSQPIALFQAYLTKKAGSLVDAEYVKIV